MQFGIQWLQWPTHSSAVIWNEMAINECCEIHYTHCPRTLLGENDHIYSGGLRPKLLDDTSYVYVFSNYTFAGELIVSVIKIIYTSIRKW